MYYICCIYSRSFASSPSSSSLTYEQCFIHSGLVCLPSRL